MEVESSAIDELSASELALAIANGEVGAESHLSHLLDRCDALSRFNAFISIDRAAALNSAREADVARETGMPMGPLHGVPLVVKDNIDVQGMRTTGGTPALRDHMVQRDAEVVRRLRKAGAIILGKTNLHELAGGSTNSNAFYGIALNPYDETRVPGGSSGGTAVALALRLAPAGLGTDTGGSNRHPAAFCGVTGFRPSTHRWSQDGLLMMSQLRDTIGPLARNVADCALLDSIACNEPIALPTASLRGLRFGIIREIAWSNLDTEVERVVENCLSRLREAGVIIVDVEFQDLNDLSDRAGIPIALGQARELMSDYLKNSYSRITADEVFEQVASPDVHAFQKLYLDSVDAATFQEGRDIHQPALQCAYDQRFREYNLDAIIFPTSPLLPISIGSPEEMVVGGMKVKTLFELVRNTNPGSIASLPGISLPAGLSTGGLPVGLALDGPRGSDRRLLAIAQAVETVLPKIKRPQK